MKKFFQKIDKKHLAVFLPLSIGAYAVGGISPLFVLAVSAGVFYIVWQVADNA